MTDRTELALATPQAERSRLVFPLRAAHQIVRNAPNLTTPQQQIRRADKNVSDGVDGKVATRAGVTHCWPAHVWPLDWRDGRVRADRRAGNRRRHRAARRQSQDQGVCGCGQDVDVKSDSRSSGSPAGSVFRIQPGYCRGGREAILAARRLAHHACAGVGGIVLEEQTHQIKVVDPETTSEPFREVGGQALQERLSIRCTIFTFLFGFNNTTADLPVRRSREGIHTGWGAVICGPKMHPRSGARA